MYIISFSHFPLSFYHFYPISTRFLPFLPKIPYFYPISTIGRVEIPNYPVECHPCPMFFYLVENDFDAGSAIITWQRQTQGELK